MPRLVLGLISGLAFGSVVAATMLPMQFPDKRAAITGAFLSRFAIGVLIGAIVGAPQVSRLGLPAWSVGLIVSLLVSIPDAIITKAYAPILVIGAVGGTIIGWVVGRFGT